MTRITPLSLNTIPINGVNVWFALRGTASTGFRAPSLQQQYFTSTASVLTNGTIVESGLFPSVSAVGRALGGRPLGPERARNLSLGTVLRGGGFDLSIDAYQIKVRNQIALSENLSGASVIGVLNANGINTVSQARFFLNGIRSTIKGIDSIAHFRAANTGAGTFDFTVAGNFNDISVNRAPAPVAINGTTYTLFSRQRIISFEQGTPRTKVVGTIDWSLGDLGGSHYGDVTQPSSNGLAADDIHTGRHTVFDVYPDYVKLVSSRGTVLNSTGLVGFPYYSPFGFNGRYLYGRVGLSW